MRYHSVLTTISERELSGSRLGGYNAFNTSDDIGWHSERTDGRQQTPTALILYGLL